MLPRLDGFGVVKQLRTVESAICRAHEHLTDELMRRLAHGNRAGPPGFVELPFASHSVRVGSLRIEGLAR
jgi:hypothetical protein